MVSLFKPRNKAKVHFLHIGKTGGSAVKAALEKHLKTPNYLITLHRHRTSLIDIPEGEQVVFFLRDPVSRFVSAFYSRQRKGRPRYNIEWSNEEKELFQAFKTPNEMACALGDPHSDHHKLSENAIKNMIHFNPQINWFVDADYFQHRINDIFYIGFQESIDLDFPAILKALVLPPSISLPSDEISAHRSPQGLDLMIDKTGICTLEERYSKDYHFIKLCKDIMKNREPN